MPPPESQALTPHPSDKPYLWALRKIDMAARETRRLQEDGLITSRLSNPRLGSKAHYLPGAPLVIFILLLLCRILLLLCRRSLIFSQVELAIYLCVVFATVVGSTIYFRPRRIPRTSARSTGVPAFGVRKAYRKQTAVRLIHAIKAMDEGECVGSLLELLEPNTLAWLLPRDWTSVNRLNRWSGVYKVSVAVVESGTLLRPTNTREAEASNELNVKVE